MRHDGSAESRDGRAGLPPSGAAGDAGYFDERGVDQGPLRQQGVVATLGLRLAFDGLRPPVPALGRVTGGSVNGTKMQEQTDARVELRDGGLAVVLDVPFDQQLPDSGRAGELIRTLDARLELENGYSLTARRVHVSGRHFGLFEGREPKSTMTLRLRDWIAQKARPSVWIAIIEGDFLGRTVANLRFVERGPKTFRSAESNVRLDGKYQWTLVGAERATFAIIDTGGAEFELKHVVTDFCALQLTYGARLGIDWLVGVDEEGLPVAWAGSGSLVSKQPTRSTTTHPPIPVNLHPGGRCWAAPFFKRSAESLAREGDRSTWIVFRTFMDSLEEHLDGAYLKLQVALEAMSYEVPRPMAAVLVKDPPAWEKWVQNREAEISSHATDPEAARKLMNKVKAAQQLPSTDAVEDAFGVLLLRPPGDLMAELKQRSRSAHRFLMSRPDADGGGRDVVNDWKRVRMMRTLLVAVYAKRIGYTGPINDAETDDYGKPQSADWWPSEGCAEADQQFVVERTAVAKE